MEKLIQLLRIAFASEYSFYLKTHYFHWNVEGIHFPQFHELFGEIYQEVYASIDPFAENIRKLGAYTPGSFDRFNMMSKIEDENSIPTAEQMVQILLDDSDKMAVIFKSAFVVAEAAGEHGLSNFLAERQDAHRKHSWMLRATLK
jgi:starvation-inducible DNA-binding protein